MYASSGFKASFYRSSEATGFPSFLQRMGEALLYKWYVYL